MVTNNKRYRELRFSVTHRDKQLMLLKALNAFNPEKESAKDTQIVTELIVKLENVASVPRQKKQKIKSLNKD